MKQFVLEEKISTERNVTWVVVDESRDHLENFASILKRQFPQIERRPIRMRIIVEALE